MVAWDRTTQIMCAVVAGILVLASAIGWILTKRATSESSRETIDNLNRRVRAWWVMVILFAAALAIGRIGVIVLFWLLSFQSLREVITLTPTRRGDHHTLFWAFFVIVPLHYYLLWIQWYGLFAIFVPVYCFLFLAIRSALTGDPKHYLERTAKIQWGVMICVYCISHAPALLILQLRGLADNWKLLVFLVAVAQISDVLQYCWGKLLGRRRIAPHLSPGKTWEGFVGGVLSATALGAAMWPITPFNPWLAAAMALLVCVLGFFGGLVMSAIKRDAGVKDYGRLIEGHGGVMDRLDSLAFAAPVFFHVVRYYYSQ